MNDTTSKINIVRRGIFATEKGRETGWFAQPPVSGFLSLSAGGGRRQRNPTYSFSPPPEDGAPRESIAGRVENGYIERGWTNLREWRWFYEEILEGDVGRVSWWQGVKNLRMVSSRVTTEVMVTALRSM